MMGNYHVRFGGQGSMSTDSYQCLQLEFLVLLFGHIICIL
jgi:hypothetical protein